MFSSTQPILSINTTDISSLVGVVFEFFANPTESNLSLIKNNTQKLVEMNASVEKLKNWAWQYADLEYAQKQFQKTQEVEKVIETTYNSLSILMKSNISEPIHEFLQKFEQLLKSLQSYRSILENDLKNEEIQKELKTLTNRKLNIV
jgi:DNA-binding transcriptional regulator GbsR (MarR family)